MVNNTTPTTKLFDELKALSEKTFSTIPLGSMKEPSITDNILSEIKLAYKCSDIIQYDDSHKETGADNDNPKTRTCADFILVIKDSHSTIHTLSFQAKSGKKEKQNDKGLGNFYKEINHKIGNDGDYQVDEYDEFIRNSNIGGYYIFYNGNFDSITNAKDQAKLNENSFWVLDEYIVKNEMGPDHKILSLTDIVDNANHKEFIDFLKGFVWNDWRKVLKSHKH